MYFPRSKVFISSLLLVGILISAFDIKPFVPGVDNEKVVIEKFDVLDSLSGWIVLGTNLFWTSDVGETWNEFGPSIPVGGKIQDVEFINHYMGWVLWSKKESNGDVTFTLASTVNHGATWNARPISFFDADEIHAYSEEADMGWFDTINGWVAVKKSSSSNFSQGTLFTTSDGGYTWVSSNLPMADHVKFDTLQIGWAYGGANGEKVFKTDDRGRTWKNINIDRPVGSQITVQEVFYIGEQGVLLATSTDPASSLNIYTLEQDPEKWSFVEHTLLDTQPGVIGLSVVDAQNFVAVITGTNSVFRMVDGELESAENLDGLSRLIVELDMVSMDVGWAKAIDAKCTTVSLPDYGSASVSCDSNTLLLYTTDGGINWQAMQLPFVRSNFASLDSVDDGRSMVVAALPNLGNTEVFIGQGFDKCEIPTISQLQTWWNNSPYKVVNLYIGGSSRACSNNALTDSYLEQLHRQGWKFIPTWVGPQAPCTGFSSRMSSDPMVTYDQGVEEANLAVERLAQLGLTYPDKTGSVVYYDIEYYGSTNAACRNAVNSFIDGWVSQLHARSNLAGVYGSTLCNTGLSDFLNISNVPDVIWPARWYHNLGEGFYDPTATVWNLGSCIPNTSWADHQRIRQYEGDHSETWGPLTLEIDSNVIDGVVAVPYTSPYVSRIIRADSNLTPAAFVDFTVNFSEAVTGLKTDAPYEDFTLTTTGVMGASIVGVSGSGDIYTVTVNTGTGNGTIRLDFVDSDGIVDSYNNPLGGVGIGNGNFTLGQEYDIIKSSILQDEFSSIGMYDGWILEQADDAKRGGTLNSTGGEIYLGDDDQNRQYRTILHFDTSLLPDDAVIVDAKLRLATNEMIIGINPFITHDKIVIEINTGAYSDSMTLQLDDFKMPSDRNGAGAVRNNLVNGFYRGRIKKDGLEYFSLTEPTQIRLRFKVDDNDNHIADMVGFFSGESGISFERPRLVIYYYIP